MGHAPKILGGCSASARQTLLGGRSAGFARRACSAMLDGISGVVLNHFLHVYNKVYLIFLSGGWCETSGSLTLVT